MSAKRRTAKDTFPVISVNWCDAYAYCKWAGKALCGKIGGGPNLPADANYAPADAWYNACSEGGTRAYPYGATYDAAACNWGGQRPRRARCGRFESETAGAGTRVSST